MTASALFFLFLTMLSRTEIANSALAHLSAGSISSINDEFDEKSRVINSVFESVAKGVIRTHRWSCCIRRQELSRLSADQIKNGDFGYTNAFPLPVDCLRFLELNGEPYKGKTEFLDINGRNILTNESTARIRYVAWVEDTTQWDVLLAEAVAIRIAQRVARRITKDGMTSGQLESLYRLNLNEAVRVNAMEVGSGENSPLEQMLERSPLVKAGRQAGGYGIARYLGYNLNLEEDR